ncbi:hypothetical protein ACIQLG_16805 [Terribacillus saccharophilus]|uniref:hypothetical protein n=1 Tax=Terribacillus saccharophilus TaxID=361277 RepID=UPI00380941FF
MPAITLQFGVLFYSRGVQMRAWVGQIVEQYTAGKRALERLKASLDTDNIEDRKVVNGIISDMDYSLE